MRFLINKSSINKKECAMKNLLLTLVSFSVLLLTGCQENSIIDPIVEPGTQKSDDPAVTTGTIVLERMLRDPQPVMNSYYIVNGQIQYQHILYFLDPVPPNPQYLVTLNLSVSANLTYLYTFHNPQSDDDTGGIISAETNDNIYIPENGSSVLIKTFEVLGRNDRMVLKCSFLVTINSIRLTAMWLELDSEPTTNELDKNTGYKPVDYPPLVNNQVN
jgi:hypothetical protein